MLTEAERQLEDREWDSLADEVARMVERMQREAKAPGGDHGPLLVWQRGGRVYLRSELGGRTIVISAEPVAWMLVEGKLEAVLYTDGEFALASSHGELVELVAPGQVEVLAPSAYDYEFVSTPVASAVPEAAE